MHCYGSSGNGKAVTPVNGDNSKGVNQLDSNMILKVTRDRECSEWLSFETNIGGSESRYISTSKEFSLNNSNSNIKTCTSLNEDKTCNTTGSGYEENLDVKQYISVMKGEWANNDFSGFAIPNLKSVDKAGWADRSIVAGSTSIFTANEKYAERQICKSYPEQDAPFNFSDKYKVQLYKCNCGSDIKVGGVCTVVDSNDPYSLVEVNRNKSLWNRKNSEDKWNGNDWCVEYDNSYTVVLSDNVSQKVIAFSYEQFQNFSTNDYLRTVLSGTSLPYYTNESPVFNTANNKNNLYNLVWVDDSQECYYKKVQYENVNTPAYHYFGSDKKIQNEVCYNTAKSKVNVGDCNMNNQDSSKFVSLKTTTEGRVDTSNSKIFGNCIEYSYSTEIYYSGSGKYNCITWIPGYISK